MSAKADSLKTIFLALGANFAIFVAKLVAALITGSGSMAAEAVHSLADCGNQVLLLIGMRQARRAASPDHPLGYGMVVYFWSFLVALRAYAALPGARPVLLLPPSGPSAGIDGVEESGQDRSSGPDEQGADEGRDDEPDDRVGPGPAGQAGQPGTYDRQRGEAVGAGVLTVSDEGQ